MYSTFKESGEVVERMEMKKKLAKSGWRCGGVV
jgi:hypothetical protein